MRAGKALGSGAGAAVYTVLHTLVRRLSSLVCFIVAAPGGSRAVCVCVCVCVCVGVEGCVLKVECEYKNERDGCVCSCAHSRNLNEAEM